jgi:hypothetical protein
VWDAVRERVARTRRVVAAELEQARPVAVAGNEVTLLVSEVLRPILDKHRAEIEAAVASVTGSAARIVYRSDPPEGAESPRAGAAGKRLDQQGERDQRLKAYRAKDQALDAVAEALDLELLD